jgi:hypothetical protein
MAFGPYILVLFDPVPGSPAALRSEWAPLFVLRSSDFKLLQVWMI